MDILVAILYYLHVLVGGQAYSQDYITTSFKANQDQIMMIQQNPDMLNRVVANSNGSSAIEVLDPSEIN